MKKRTLDEMVIYFNQALSEMDIDHDDKMRIAGMAFAIAYEVVNIQFGQPKIIRCRDCEHNYVDGENVRYNACKLNHNKLHSDEWYCADAERKTDETN